MRSGVPPVPTDPDRVAAFLRSRSGGSVETVRTYGKRLARYVAASGGAEIDRERYDAYIDAIKRQGRRPNGIALDANVLLLYAQFSGVRTEGWQHPKWREVPVEWLRDAEYDALRRAALDSPRDGEDRAFALDLLRGTGIRLNEFLSLKWRDLDLEEGRLVVRSGKGGKPRAIPLPEDGPPEMRRAIGSAREAFWRRYPKKSLDEARAVRDFVWPEREAYKIHNWLRAAAIRASLTGLVHPHTLRHSFATGLVLQGVPAPVVQRLLGHASLGTTSRYTRATGADIVDALRSVGRRSDGRDEREEEQHGDSGVDAVPRPP